MKVWAARNSAVPSPSSSPMTVFSERKLAASSVRNVFAPRSTRVAGPSPSARSMTVFCPWKSGALGGAATSSSPPIIVCADWKPTSFFASGALSSGSTSMSVCEPWKSARPWSSSSLARCSRRSFSFRSSGIPSSSAAYFSMKGERAAPSRRACSPRARFFSSSSSLSRVM